MPKGVQGHSWCERSAHPESYHSYKSERDTVSTGKTNSGQTKSGKTTRAPWSQEETTTLALYESRLVRRGCPTGRQNLNEELAQLMSGRTSEAIKSHRRAGLGAHVQTNRHLMSLKDGALGPDNRGRKDLRELSSRSLQALYYGVDSKNARRG